MANVYDLPDMLRLLPADECRLLKARYGLMDGVSRSARAAFDITYPAKVGRSSTTKSAKVRAALARAWLRATLVEIFQLLGDYTVSEQPERLMAELRLALKVSKLAVRSFKREFPTCYSSEIFSPSGERRVIEWLGKLGAEGESYHRRLLRAELARLAQMIIEAEKERKEVI